MECLRPDSTNLSDSSCALFVATSYFFLHVKYRPVQFSGSVSTETEHIYQAPVTTTKTTVTKKIYSLDNTVLPDYNELV